MPRSQKKIRSTHAVIARRAYELFVQRGGEHGRDWEDWLNAERELSPDGRQKPSLLARTAK